MYFAQFEICNYLMDLGAEPSPKLLVHKVASIQKNLQNENMQFFIRP